MNLTERAETRRETFYKLTNSADVPEVPSAGGRNLLSKTNQGKLKWSWRFSSGGTTAEDYNVDGVKAVKMTRTSDASFTWHYIQYDGLIRKLIEPNTKYTLSFDVKPSVDVTFTGELSRGDGGSKLTNYVRMNKAMANQWTKVSCVLTSKTTLPDDLSQVVYLSGMPTAKDNYLIIKNIKLEKGENQTPYSPAPEDLGWSKDTLVPTQSNRYLWKFEYIYYSDGSVEIAGPVNLSIAGQNGAIGPKGDQGIQGLQGPKGDQGIAGKDGSSIYNSKYTGIRPNLSNMYITDLTPSVTITNLVIGSKVISPSGDVFEVTSKDPNSNPPSFGVGPLLTNIKGKDGLSQYTHIAYADNDKGGGFSQTDQNKPYIGMYQDYTATDSSDPARYHWSKWKGDDGVQGVPGKPGTDGRTPYIHFAYANSADGRTNFSNTYFSGALYIGTLADYNQNDNTNYAAYTWSRMKGEDGVIESNGENRIFYGRGDTKKGFFKNATIGTDWNGVPYGEFDLSQWHVTGTTQRWDSVTTTDGLKLLGNSTTIPTGKWTMTHDIYLTDSMEGCGGYNYVRAGRLPGEGFHDIAYIDMDKPIISNKCRRAIWNPEPDRQAYGGNPLINPLEVTNHNNSPVKITTKCVPDELGNGVTQYIIESTSSNPTGSLNIPSVRNAIPQDANKTWTATLKIRANKTCKLSHLGFERFSVMHDVTIKPEWQTLYFNGKADGTYGTFVLYGLDPQALSSKVVIEIAEVKICDENVSKEEMSKTLLTRYWYRISKTREFTEANRIGLNGSVTGGVQISIPAGKKTDAKIRLRNVSLRHGDAEIPFAPAPEDIYDQNNSKVDQDQLDQIANELRDRQDRLAQELAAKALASEVSELTTQIKNLKESDLAGKADITNAVASLEKRLANVIPLGDMAQKLQFIDSYILQGEEGMEIGNKNSGSKVMITPDRIGFFSGGTEVASFSSGQLRINNGFFADTITVGHFMTRRHPNNQYVNGTYFVK